MKRREFITLLGGAAAAWPVAVRAQQAESTPRIGLLWPGDAPPASPRMELFRQGLRALGFIDGQNIAIELRYAQRGPQQLAELAAELISLKVNVILAPGDLAPKLAQQATETIPIVAGGDDILGAGVVASLSRPRREHHRAHHPFPGTQREKTGDTAGHNPRTIAGHCPLGPDDRRVAGDDDNKRGSVVEFKAASPGSATSRGGRCGGSCRTQFAG